MESSTRTEELHPANAPAGTDPVVADVRQSVNAAVNERCAGCGAPMAADQRYCVECGLRRGPGRVPFVEGIAQPKGEAPGRHRSSLRRPRSVDATLVAGVGTLLLALGIGVLIGRSSNGTSSKSARVQVVTVAGGGSGASAGTTGAGASASTSGANSSTSTTKAAASHANAKVSATLAAKKAAAGPPPKVVTIGSAGHGPGYQNGHFTGNFFGP
jgi:hypothetical protein